LAKAKLIENSVGLFPEHSYLMRKAFFCKKGSGILYKNEKTPARDPMMGLMSMTNGAMFDNIKNNIWFAITSAIQYAWVSFFFSGFIIGKVPFPLTQKFRGMLQQGVFIESIDVRYVSSLSLYFLALFGLSGLQNLILGADEEGNALFNL